MSGTPLGNKRAREQQAAAAAAAAATTAKRPAPTPPLPEQHRFELHDDESWRAHLEAQGFVVIAGVADAAQLEVARGQVWDGIEASSAAHGVRRGDAHSWRQWHCLDRRGFLLQPAVVHGAGAWGVRSLPRVRAAFERIWGTADLLVSLDAVIAWRPWWLHGKPSESSGGGSGGGGGGSGDGASSSSSSSSSSSVWEAWRPQTEGLHLDQNPWDKPGLCSVQGMVPLLDVTAATGGLEVAPASHTDAAKAELKRRKPFLAGAGDWCPGLADLYPATAAAAAAAAAGASQAPAVRLVTAPAVRLVTARAGDLVLWDSRTVHGGRVGDGGRGGEEAAAAGGGAACAGGEGAAGGEGLVGKMIRIAYPNEDGEGSTYWPVTVKGYDTRTKKHLVVGEGFESCEDLEDCHWRGMADLARLTVTVCMTPRAWASEAVLQVRRDAFAAGRALTHWPHEAPGTGANSSRRAADGYEPIALSDAQRALL